MTARAARRGETVTDTTLGTDQPYMVLGPCAHRAHGYWCDAHRTFLKNVGNLTMHLQDDAPRLGGACRIVDYCPTCRVYREADQSQLDALNAPLLDKEP